MTSDLRIKTDADSRAFRIFGAARKQRMACKRIPMLAEAASLYRTAGNAAFAAKLERIGGLANLADFQAALEGE